MTVKFLQNEFFNRVWPETTIVAEFAIKNCIISTTQTPKSSSERLIPSKSTIFVEFSRIFALHFSSGIASAYRKPIFTIPGSHPSL